MEAATAAINSPLLETTINGASGIILNVTGGPDMTLHEVTEAAQVIHDAVSEDAIVTFGSVIDDRIQGEIQITVIATGFELKNAMPKAKEEPRALSAADFFSNSFSANSISEQPQSIPVVNKSAQEVASSLLDIPEFLKK